MAYKGKYARPSASHAPTLMRVAFLLLCLLMLSVYLMGGLLAKYNSTGSGNDEARVAKFEVLVSGVPQDSDIVCTAVDSGSSTYTITIENRSEVAVRYNLSVEFLGDSSGVGHSFSPQSDDLAAGATGSSILTFTVDWDEFTSNKTGPSASVELDFTVIVNVTQID